MLADGRIRIREAKHTDPDPQHCFFLLIFMCLQTLLPQYLAMYRLTVDNQETYMVVTRNVFSGFLKIHRKYDLKGKKIYKILFFFIPLIS